MSDSSYDYERKDVSAITFWATSLDQHESMLGLFERKGGRFSASLTERQDGAVGVMVEFEEEDYDVHFDPKDIHIVRVPFGSKGVYLVGDT